MNIFFFSLQLRFCDILEETKKNKYFVLKQFYEKNYFYYSFEEQFKANYLLHDNEMSFVKKLNECGLNENDAMKIYKYSINYDIEDESNKNHENNENIIFKMGLQISQNT